MPSKAKRRRARKPLSERLGEELDALAEKAQKRGKLLQAHEVVEWAKAHPKSALHTQFTWDTGKAAYERWLEQARRVIRLYVSTKGPMPEEHRVYVSLYEDRSQPKGGYRSLVTVLSLAEQREALLTQALAEAQAWQRKYESLRELAAVFAEIESATGKVQKRRGRRRAQVQKS